MPRNGDKAEQILLELNESQKLCMHAQVIGLSALHFRVITLDCLQQSKWGEMCRLFNTENGSVWLRGK